MKKQDENRTKKTGAGGCFHKKTIKPINIIEVYVKE